MSKGLYSKEINWIPYPPKEKEFECYAKFRYRQPDQKVKVTIDGKGAYVAFDKPQRAVTTGQYVVFYTDTECLGGGIIDRVDK